MSVTNQYLRDLLGTQLTTTKPTAWYVEAIRDLAGRLQAERQGNKDLRSQNARLREENRKLRGGGS